MKERARRALSPLAACLGLACFGIAMDWGCGTRRALPIVASGSVVLGFVCWAIGTSRQRPVLLHLGFAVIVVAVFALWHHHDFRYCPHDDLSAFAGNDPSPAVVMGRLVAPVEFAPAPDFDPMQIIPGEPTVYFRIRAEQIRVGGVWQKVSGIVLVAASGAEHKALVGELLQAWGNLGRPRPPLNPGEFDYRLLARQRRESTLMRCESVDCVERIEAIRNGFPLLARVQNWARGQLKRYVSERNWGLATALFLGARRELEEDRKRALLETGVLHLVAISGSHMVFLAGLVLSIMRIWPTSRRSRLVLASSVCVAYSFLAGNEPPVARATVFVVLATASELWGRRWNGLHVLAAAALLVLLRDPLMALNAGAQLSFLAVAVLIRCAKAISLNTSNDPLDRLIASSRPWLKKTEVFLWKSTKDALWTGAMVWLVTAPLVWSLFHLVSPITILLTPILSVFIAIALSAGFLLLLGGGLWQPVGHICGDAIDFSLDATIAITDFVHRNTACVWWSRGPAIWWLAGFYLIVLWLILTPRLNAWAVRCACAAVSVWIGIGLIWDRAEPRLPDETRVTMVSVGHGLATLIELPDGGRWLYDAGSMGGPVACARRIAGVLWSRDITALSGVVISHADADHYNGLPELTRMVHVDRVFTTWQALSSDSKGIQACAAALQAKRIPLTVIRSGTRLNDDSSVKMRVLMPDPGKRFASDNAASAVIALTTPHDNLLLTGDLEGQGMQDWLRLANQKTTSSFAVVQSPHHGSPNLALNQFYRSTRAEIVLISGDKRYGNLHKQRTPSQDRPQFFHTAYHGAITVRMLPTGNFVHTFLGE